MDEEAADFGAIEFEGVFEFGDDLVDAGHGEIVGEGAVAVDLDALDALLAVDSEGWRKEMRDLSGYFAEYGGKIPADLLEEHRRVMQSLG